MFSVKANPRAFSRMARYSKTLLHCAIAVLFLFPLAGFAETLSGTVLDPQGKNIPNARIRLFDRAGGQIRSATSSSDGAFSFPGINAGNYLIEADTSTGTL